MNFVFNFQNKKNRLAIKIVFLFLTLVVYGYVLSTGLGGERGVLLYALILSYIGKVWKSKNTLTNKIINGFILWIVGSVIGVVVDVIFPSNNQSVIILLFVLFLFSTTLESDHEQ